MLWITDLLALLQIVLIDLSLAGDNAIVVGTAAAGLPQDKRHQAIFSGILAATFLRVIFAIFAVKLLHVTGLLAAGGLVLLWVAWKMYRDLRHMYVIAKHHDADDGVKKTLGSKRFSRAIMQIVIADVSMSLDNVLAVAGVARDHFLTLILGLILSVGLMGVASGWVAKLVARFHWVGFFGLVVVLYTSLHMIWDGVQQIRVALNLTPINL